MSSARRLQHPEVPAAQPDPEAARSRLGFRDGERGTHSGRTLMLRELALLLDAVPPDASPSDYRRAVIDENVLGKRTHSNRLRTYKHLKPLYGLDPGIPLFRALRWLWDLDAGGRPLLALLCAFARDPLLRMTAPPVLDAAPGSRIEPAELEELLRREAPGRFSESSLRSIARNALSTWTQSGHLAGRVVKTRTRAKPTPGSTVYALFLAHLEGRRAQRLFTSSWARLLDAPAPRLLELARLASRRGWIVLRNAGSVVEVRFPGFLLPQEPGSAP